MNKSVRIEVVEGREGPCLLMNDYRVAGPKPWGGGKVNQRFQWDTTTKRLMEAISRSEEYPEQAQKRKRILALIDNACSYEPNDSVLKVICSCFAAGDISHISDDELIENLEALIDVEQRRLDEGHKRWGT